MLSRWVTKQGAREAKGGGHLTSWGHNGVGAEAETAMSELGLDKARGTGPGVRIQKGIRRNHCGERWAEGPLMPFQEAGS